jgi:hypothetical protein
MAMPVPGRPANTDAVSTTHAPNPPTKRPSDAGDQSVRSAASGSARLARRAGR